MTYNGERPIGPGLDQWESSIRDQPIGPESGLCVTGGRGNIICYRSSDTVTFVPKFPSGGWEYQDSARCGGPCVVSFQVPSQHGTFKLLQL